MSSTYRSRWRNRYYWVARARVSTGTSALLNKAGLLISSLSYNILSSVHLMLCIKYFIVINQHINLASTKFIQNVVNRQVTIIPDNEELFSVLNLIFDKVPVACMTNLVLYINIWSMLLFHMIHLSTLIFRHPHYIMTLIFWHP